jgi:hypothetical protein
MAKITLSPMLKDIRGKLGDIVFRRLPNGELIVSKTPDLSKVKWRKTHRQDFTKAGKHPFDLAVTGYFKDNYLLSPKRK